MQDPFKTFIEKLTNSWSASKLPNPDNYPITFEYYIKLYKYLESRKTK